MQKPEPESPAGKEVSPRGTLSPSSFLMQRKTLCPETGYPSSFRVQTAVWRCSSTALHSFSLFLLPPLASLLTSDSIHPAKSERERDAGDGSASSASAIASFLCSSRALLPLCDSRCCEKFRSLCLSLSLTPSTLVGSRFPLLCSSVHTLS